MGNGIFFLELLIFKFEGDYPSTFVNAPMKTMNVNCLNQILLNVPNDVTGVWHLWLIFFEFKGFLTFSNAIKTLQMICPRKVKT